MPGSNTTDSSETSVSLSGKSADTESLDDTVGTFTSGDSDDVDHLVVLENLTDGDLVFELLLSPVDLLGNSSSVDLNFEQMSLLLSEVKLGHLGVAQNSHNSAVLLYSLNISLNGFLALGIFLPSLDILRESLSLSVVPVLVELSLDLIRNGLGPHGGECSETSGGVDVTNETDNLDGRGLDNGNGLDDVLLEDLLTFSSFVISSDVSHTSLVTNESSQVDWLLWVISGE